jgi:oxygen-independent coproporphyrinogen-3 oxidase
MSNLASLGITAEKIRAYDQRIPRYTSYPTAPFWREDFDAAAWRAHVEAHAGATSPLALYIHLPFCEKHCLFCACNVIITPRRDVVARYLGFLEREVEMTSRLARPAGEVIQLHLGGGTPNYLSIEQMARLVDVMTTHFPFAANAERSIEVDPRLATPEYVAALHDRCGFGRISFGTQDFHDETQAAIGRGQARALTFANVAAARAAGFGSVNIDLIYGLPRQTEQSWRETLAAVGELLPDRIALYNFAYLPDKLAHQRALANEVLPEPALKLQMFIEAHNALTAAGYVFIGMDHYARRTDSLTRALEAGTLRRNFMGYNTLRGTDMLAFGTSAISDAWGAFAQNVKKLSVYERMVGEGVLPVERGLLLDEDDLLRRFIIEEVMCNGRLTLEGPVAAIVEAEAAALDPLEADGLLVRQPGELVVTNKGRIFLRNIAVVFDAHLRRARSRHQFSRAV